MSVEQLNESLADGSRRAEDGDRDSLHGCFRRACRVRSCQGVSHLMSSLANWLPVDGSRLTVTTFSPPTGNREPSTGNVFILRRVLYKPLLTLIAAVRICWN